MIPKRFCRSAVIFIGVLVSAVCHANACSNCTEYHVLEHPEEILFWLAVSASIMLNIAFCYERFKTNKNVSEVTSSEQAGVK